MYGCMSKSQALGTAGFVFLLPSRGVQGALLFDPYRLPNVFFFFFFFMIDIFNRGFELLQSHGLSTPCATRMLRHQ